MRVWRASRRRPWGRSLGGRAAAARPDPLGPRVDVHAPARGRSRTASCRGRRRARSRARSARRRPTRIGAPATAAFWTSSNDSRPLTHSTWSCSGSSPSSSARPTTLSIALWRPTSSRTQQQRRRRRRRGPVACRPPVRVEAGLAQAARAGSRAARAARRGPGAAAAARGRRPPRARPSRRPRTTTSCRSAGAPRRRAPAAASTSTTLAARSAVGPGRRAGAPRSGPRRAGSRARAPRRGRACASSPPARTPRTRISSGSSIATRSATPSCSTGTDRRRGSTAIAGSTLAELAMLLIDTRDDRPEPERPNPRATASRLDLAGAATLALARSGPARHRDRGSRVAFDGWPA